MLTKPTPILRAAIIASRYQTLGGQPHQFTAQAVQSTNRNARMVSSTTRYVSKSAMRNILGPRMEGIILPLHNINHEFEKKEGIDAGFIGSVSGVPVIVKRTGKPNHHISELDAFEFNKTDPENNIAGRKEVASTIFLQKFVAVNSFPILIPNTGMAYEVRSDRLEEYVISQLIPNLDPTTSEPHNSYFTIATEKLYEEGYVKDFHNLLIGWSMLRAYDPTGACYRNIGFSKLKGGGSMLSCWDNGVALQEHPPSKGWSAGNMDNALRAIDRLRGIDCDNIQNIDHSIFRDLPNPMDIVDPLSISSQDLAKAIMQSTSLSNITAIKLPSEKEIRASFEVLRQIPKELSIKERELYDQFEPQLEENYQKYVDKMLSRSEQIKEMQNILNMIYPVESGCDHSKILLPPLQVVAQLYKLGVNTAEIAALVDKITPDSRKEIFAKTLAIKSVHATEGVNPMDGMCR